MEARSVQLEPERQRRIGGFGIRSRIDRGIVSFDVGERLRPTPSR